MSLVLSFSKRFLLFLSWTMVLQATFLENAWQGSQIIGNRKCQKLMLGWPYSMVFKMLCEMLSFHLGVPAPSSSTAFSLSFLPMQTLENSKAMVQVFWIHPHGDPDWDVGPWRQHGPASAVADIQRINQRMEHSLLLFAAFQMNKTTYRFKDPCSILDLDGIYKRSFRYIGLRWIYKNIVLWSYLKWNEYLFINQLECEIREQCISTPTCYFLQVGLETFPFVDRHVGFDSHSGCKF